VLAGGQEDVAVVALRYPAPGYRGVRKLVPVEEEYRVEPAGHARRRRKPRDPGTDDRNGRHRNIVTDPTRPPMVYALQEI
jgi:hypothetical protein